MWETAVEVLSQEVEICIFSFNFKIHTFTRGLNVIGKITSAEDTAFFYKTIIYRNVYPLKVDRSCIVLCALSLSIFFLFTDLLLVLHYFSGDLSSEGRHLLLTCSLTYFLLRIILLSVILLLHLVEKLILFV